MAFALSSWVITQTWTETDLAWLSWIAGVTITEIGTWNYLRRIAVLTNTWFAVSWTMNLFKDELIIMRNDTNVTASMFNINNWWVFNLWQETTVVRDTWNVIVKDSFEPALKIRRYTWTSWYDTDLDFNVLSGWTFNQYWAYIETTVPFVLAVGWVLKTRDATWSIITYSPSAVDWDYINCYLRGVLDIKWWKVVGNWFTLVWFLATAYTNFIWYEPININQPVGSIDGNASIVDVNDYYAWANPMDVSIRVKTSQWTNWWFDIYGSNLWNELIVKWNPNNQWYWRVHHFIRYKPKVETLLWVAIESVNMYLIDSDSGNRDTVWPWWVPLDQTYTKTTDINWDVLNTNILTGVWSNYNNGSLWDFTVESRLPVIWRCWHYNYLPQVASVNDSKVIWTFAPVIQMIVDALITETIQATVDAYTTIDDAQELYDVAKSYIYTNYIWSEDVLISRAWNQIWLVAENLIIDATAWNTFTYNWTDTITIKSTTFTGWATATTGVVTLNNWATLNGWTFDCDVYLNSAQDLTDVTINWDLHINTGANSTLDFSNVTVTGDILNDDAIHTLVINSTNGSNLTTTEPWTWNWQVDIQNSVTLTFTWLVAWTEVRILEAGTNTEVDGIESAGVTWDYVYNYPTWYDIDVVIHHLDYKYKRIDWIILAATDWSIPVSQEADRYYINP